MKLKDRVAIITGGASGQGAAITRLFLSEGAKVVVADVRSASVADLEQNPGDLFLDVPTDVSDEGQVQHLVEETVRVFGGVDILINSAGRLGPLGKDTADQLTMVEWQQTLGVNLLGAWLCIKYAAPIMRQRGGGSIVNIASTAGLRPFAGSAPYCVSKAALLMLTRTVALEYVVDNIRVNSICPGHIDTPMMDRVIADMVERGTPDAYEKVHTTSNPMKRLARAEEVATAALFLAADDSSFVTGSELIVDGGYLAG